MLIQIKSKSYYPLTTVLNGLTFRIPPKNNTVEIEVEKISEHLQELIANKKIKVDVIKD